MVFSMLSKVRTAPQPAAWILGVVGAAALALPGAALAKNCGDDVAGTRVACSCGDNVVSDTVLWATDPVVSEPCSGDGLVVMAPSGSDGLTLNLGGQSLLGNGRGAGIRVARGGRLGSILVGGDADDSRAEIARFGTGIRASGRNALREVSGIDIHDNARDGLYLRTSGVRVADVVTERNGRSGAAVSGHGNAVEGVVADGNLRDGLQVRGTGATVDADTSGNRRNGTVVGGRGNRVRSLRSSDNGATGVLATGAGHDVAGVEAIGNGAGDVVAHEGAVR